jgi:nitroimidazol reductase NimA-like FMN-containing flavoprotein (pyridoxamine 5'-phosphate oxidase superfamily)
MEVTRVTEGGSAREEILDRRECLRLLESQRVGRLVVNVKGWVPVIRPVNYAFDVSSQCVVFRTARGSKLTALLLSQFAAFEVDEVEESARSGWSVIVTGRAEEVSRPADLAHLEALGLDPWAPGERPHWVRIRTGTMSGRRIRSTPPGRPA